LRTPPDPVPAGIMETRLAALLDVFDDFPDPRIDRTKHHLVRDIVVLTILAALCGADGFVDIERFGHAKEEWLRKILPLPNGIPSHDTLGRVFAMLDPSAFADRPIEARQHTGDPVAIAVHERVHAQSSVRRSCHPGPPYFSSGSAKAR